LPAALPLKTLARGVHFDDLAPFADQAFVAHFHVDQLVRHRTGGVHAPDRNRGQRHQQRRHDGKADAETGTDIHVFHGEF